MSRLVIIGAGGHGAVVADAALLINKWSDIVFLDDHKKTDSTCLDLKIDGGLELIESMVDPAVEFIVAIGNNSDRLKLIDRIDKAGGKVAQIAHPSAIVSSHSVISDGVVVCAGAVLNPDSKVGSGAIINTGATIDHDCVIGEGAHISPGVHVAGGVSVGPRSWVGVGASICDAVTIGSDVVVGAGAVVTSNLMSNRKYVGVPAKEVGSN